MTMPVAGLWREKRELEKLNIHYTLNGNGVLEFQYTGKEG